MNSVADVDVVGPVTTVELSVADAAVELGTARVAELESAAVEDAVSEAEYVSAVEDRELAVETAVVTVALAVEYVVVWSSVQVLVLVLLKELCEKAPVERSEVATLVALVIV